MIIHPNQTLGDFLKANYPAPERVDREVFAKFGIEAFVDPALPVPAAIFPRRVYTRYFDRAGNLLEPLIDETT